VGAAAAEAAREPRCGQVSSTVYCPRCVLADTASDFRLIEAFDAPITRALPEHNLDELLQVTYHSVACKELHRRSKVEVPPLAYARPPGMFGAAVDDASKCV